jgi:hypothetical protein
MLLMTLIAASLSFAQPAAAPETAATLATPGAARSQALDGRIWTCAPDGACIARGAGASQPPLRECRRFVARFGAVTRYVRDGVAFDQADLTRCNAAVG